ncbi:MAG: ribosome silencing factor [Candidatus Omnitrophota bacterium]
MAHEKKADDIVILDMRMSSGFCDYFVIAGAESTRRARTISEAIEEGLGRIGIRVSHTEGKEESLWIVLDHFDVVTHIFYHETRKFYDLERLWREAPREVLSFPKCHESILKKK